MYKRLFLLCTVALTAFACGRPQAVVERTDIYTRVGDVGMLVDAIEITGGDFMKTQIYVWSKDIDMSELSFELAVRWNLRGSYSKKEMEVIELSGSYEYTGSVG